MGRKIEQFEIENYTPLVAEAERLEFTHETALLTSILNQEKLANELLAALGQGKGPLDKLVKKVSSGTRGGVDVHSAGSLGSQFRKRRVASPNSRETSDIEFIRFRFRL